MKNSRKSHYTDVVRTFKSNEQTVCHLLMSLIYVSYLLSVPRVPTTNQKWGHVTLCVRFNLTDVLQVIQPTEQSTKENKQQMSTF